MVFSSLIFLYVFLPLQFFIYYLIPGGAIKAKNAVLLAFSLIFYSWSGPFYLLILLFESFVCWFFSGKIQKYKDNKDDKNKDRSKLCLISTTVILLLILFCFKYLTFCSDLINKAMGFTGLGTFPVIQVALPIGISFYTFQLISYVADVYMKKVEASKSYFKILLYASLFHQCIAGPIVRYELIANEIDNRKADLNDIFAGIKRFSIGLAKKAVLANGVATLADNLLPLEASEISSLPVAALWLGAICYTLQIFLDFAAYSDMAIGLGRMAGFHYAENFNYPYIAKSIQDFWRRWHISLSTFFRDYVYIPLGGSRVKAFRHIINLLIVWMLTGLWHGASTNFILWGLYYFVFLIIEKYLFKNRTIPVLGNIYALIVITLGWVLFRFDSFTSLRLALTGMFGQNGNAFIDMQTTTALKSNIFLLVYAVLACTPLFKKISELLSSDKNKFLTISGKVINLLLPAILLLLSTIALVGNSYNPFLYFRF